jgi:autotransporter-associated beta strand protein
LRKFKRRQRHSLGFCLFLAVVGALLLPAALAPRANAEPTPAPELFSQPQGVLINQPLASNYNPNLALNVASGGPAAGFQPLVPDANASWTGAVSNVWSLAGNWTAGGPPVAGQIATFDANFTGANQPNLAAAATVGELHMATGVTQNVTISGSAALTIGGVGGTGILIDNTNAFTLTITAPVTVSAAQAWTNNSGNLFTKSGTVALGNNTALTVNGTGDTTLSGVISGMGGSLTKAGSGTLTLTAFNSYDGGTTVNGGTLLVNGTGNLGTGAVTVNNGGTLGGNSTFTITPPGTRVTVAAGGNLAPGNGGHDAAQLQIGALTLSPGANLRIDLNSPVQGGGYDFVNIQAGNAIITGSNLVVHVSFPVMQGTPIFSILHATNGITGQFAQGTSVVADNGQIFTIIYSGTDIVIVWSGAFVVPEPSTWIGGALAIAGLAFTQRRKLRELVARRCAVGS